VNLSFENKVALVTGAASGSPRGAGKERVTFQLPVGLIEKVRDVVFFSLGLTLPRSL
jgi:hypothetical protein